MTIAGDIEVVKDYLALKSIVEFILSALRLFPASAGLNELKLYQKSVPAHCWRESTHTIFAIDSNFTIEIGLLSAILVYSPFHWPICGRYLSLYCTQRGDHRRFPMRNSLGNLLEKYYKPAKLPLGCLEDKVRGGTTDEQIEQSISGGVSEARLQS